MHGRAEKYINNFTGETEATTSLSRPRHRWMEL
jgi:hypothetical protein